MLDRIFPRVIDNAYRGHALALWMFMLILLFKTAIALGTIFKGREAAQSADGIPLDTYGPDGAQTVLALFAIWGLSQLVFSGIGITALIRYRSMIPLLFLFFLIEHLARRLMFLVKPIVRTGSPPGLWINLGILALMIAGLVLSVRSRGDVPLPR